MLFHVVTIIRPEFEMIKRPGISQRSEHQCSVHTSTRSLSMFTNICPTFQFLCEILIGWIQYTYIYPDFRIKILWKKKKQNFNTFRISASSNFISKKKMKTSFFPHFSEIFKFSSNKNLSTTRF